MFIVETKIEGLCQLLFMDVPKCPYGGWLYLCIGDLRLDLLSNHLNEAS